MQEPGAAGRDGHIGLDSKMLPLSSVGLAWPLSGTCGPWGKDRQGRYRRGEVVLQGAVFSLPPSWAPHRWGGTLGSRSGEGPETEGVPAVGLHAFTACFHWGVWKHSGREAWKAASLRHAARKATPRDLI